MRWARRTGAEGGLRRGPRRDGPHTKERRKGSSLWRLRCPRASNKRKKQFVGAAKKRRQTCHCDAFGIDQSHTGSWQAVFAIELKETMLLYTNVPTSAVESLRPSPCLWPRQAGRG